MTEYIIAGLVISIVFLAFLIFKLTFIDLKLAYEDINLLKASKFTCNNKIKYFQKRCDSQSETILVMLKRNALLTNTVKKQADEIESLNKLLGK